MVINQSQSARSIAESLFRDLKSKRLSKIGIDEVRSAIVGFNACLTEYDRPMTNIEFGIMETQVLRMIIEKC